MKKNGYFFNAAVLTATSLVLRAAGMVFRVVVAGKIGAEGMGLHQLIFTVYQLFITAATAGLSVAATRLVTEELAAGRPGTVDSALGRCLALGAGLGTLAGLAQFAFAAPISRWWLGDMRAAVSLRILAPSLPFMAAAAALRGYFLARRRAGPNAVAQLFEQALRIALVLFLLEKALPLGIEASCAAVVAGNTASEAGSCLVEWETPLKAVVTVEPSGEDAASLEDFLGRTARLYARYVSADVSFAELREVLVPGTGFYNGLRTFDSSWYVSHDSTDFEDFSVSQLEAFGPDAAAGTVRFTYMVYKEGLRPRSYPSVYRMYAVRQENGWKLLDLQVQ